MRTLASNTYKTKMARTLDFSHKQDVTVLGHLNPSIKITRKDTLEEVVLNLEAWNSLFSFHKEISGFFKHERADFHIWLPIDGEKIKLHCFKNYKGKKIVELRKHVRGLGNQYHLLYSTNDGFTVNQYSWEKLLICKQNIDQNINLLFSAKNVMKEIVLREVTDKLLEISKSCENLKCKNSIAHDVTCKEGFGLNYKDRVEKNIVTIIPLLDSDKIILEYVAEFGLDPRINNNCLYYDIVHDVESLKSDLIY